MEPNGEMYEYEEMNGQPDEKTDSNTVSQTRSIPIFPDSAIVE